MLHEKLRRLADNLPIDGTTGAPLGGIGAGAVKFCSRNGTFAATFSAPAHQYDFTAQSNMQFQLFTDRNGTVQTSQKLSATVTNGRADDAAVYPIQYANFGTTNGVTVRLVAFLPISSKFYVDPASGFIHSTNCGRTIPYKIYDLFGKELIGKTGTSINTSVLAAGEYIIRISAGRQNHAAKICFTKYCLKDTIFSKVAFNQLTC